MRRPNGAGGASGCFQGAKIKLGRLVVGDGRSGSRLEAKVLGPRRWVARKGGVVGVGVNVSRSSASPGTVGVSSRRMRIDADDGSKRGVNTGGSPTVVHPGDVVARVPIALALSHVAARTYRVDDAPVGDLLGDSSTKRGLLDVHDVTPQPVQARLISVRQEPYIRTYRVEPSVAVLKELQGTYADEARQEWDARVKAAPAGGSRAWAAPGFSRQMVAGKARRRLRDVQQGRRAVGALGVVRSRAVWIARRGSGRAGAFVFSTFSSWCGFWTCFRATRAPAEQRRSAWMAS